jgi:predicted nucleotidyltransferase
MTAKVRTIALELRRRFEALYGPRLKHLVLYGSQARGDAEPGSDVDVLVVLRGPVEPCAEIARTIEDVGDLSLQLNVVVACVFVSEEEFEHERSPLLLNVRSEGIAV